MSSDHRSGFKREAPPPMPSSQTRRPDATTEDAHFGSASTEHGTINSPGGSAPSGNGHSSDALPSNNSGLRARVEETKEHDTGYDHGADCALPAEAVLPNRPAHVLQRQPSLPSHPDKLQPDVIQLLATSLAEIANVLRAGNAPTNQNAVAQSPRAYNIDPGYSHPRPTSLTADDMLKFGSPGSPFRREPQVEIEPRVVREESFISGEGQEFLIRRSSGGSSSPLSLYETTSDYIELPGSNTDDAGTNLNGVSAYKSDIQYSATFCSPLNSRYGAYPQVVRQEVPIKVKQVRRRKVLGDTSRHSESPAFEVWKLYAVNSGSFRQLQDRERSNRRKINVYRQRPPYAVEDGSMEYSPDGITREQDQVRVDAAESPIEIESSAGTILNIYSPQIIRAIDNVTTTFPGLTWDGKSAIVTEPFCVLLYFREQMMNQRACDFAAADQTRTLEEIDTPTHSIDDISLIYSFIDEQYSKAFLLEQQRWSRQPAICTFPWIWHMFAPGTLVYANSSVNTPTMQAFRVETFRLRGLFDDSGGRPVVSPRRLDSPTLASFETAIDSIVIEVVYLLHNGRRWIQMPKTFSILPFQGEKLISELPIIPVKYFDDPNDTIRDQLVRRGLRYETLTSRSQVEYHGESLSGVRRRIDSRIIVDLETYHFDQELAKGIQYVRFERSSDQRLFGKEADDASHVAVVNPPKEFHIDGGYPYSQEAPEGTLLPEDFSLSGESHMICSHEIYAYVLSDKEWVLLAVESISDCTFSERMIEDLQISSEARRLILALSQTYAVPPSNPKPSKNGICNINAPWSSDFIPNKGRGQILLLHGKPGVGKTSTAECVAELTRRPLLTITCGDLGNNPVDVERELTRWLRLGALWNGIILFDEADIFLEARTHGDIARNSLISVFLRALEYYQGLLFLTTNRVGSFDEAILSRVHVVLHFPDLTDQDRARIWDTSFRKLRKERPDIEVDFTVMNYAYNDQSIRDLHWNGREIRNAFNTMMALAEYDAKQNNRYSDDGKTEVRREHLQEVTKMSYTFKQYMQSLVGMDAAAHAKSLGLRDDTFDLDRGQGVNP